METNCIRTSSDFSFLLFFLVCSGGCTDIAGALSVEVEDFELREELVKDGFFTIAVFLTIGDVNAVFCKEDEDGYLADMFGLLDGIDPLEDEVFLTIGESVQTEARADDVDGCAITIAPVNGSFSSVPSKLSSSVKSISPSSFRTESYPAACLFGSLHRSWQPFPQLFSNLSENLNIFGNSHPCLHRR